MLYVQTEKEQVFIIKVIFSQENTLSFGLDGLPYVDGQGRSLYLLGLKIKNLVSFTACQKVILKQIHIIQATFV